MIPIKNESVDILLVERSAISSQSIERWIIAVLSIPDPLPIKSLFLCSKIRSSNPSGPVKFTPIKFSEIQSRYVVM